MATHIGQEISQEVLDSLDDETKSILDGSHPYVTEKKMAKRLAIAERRRIKKKPP